MGSKAMLKTNFTVEAKYDAYFTGQRVEVTSDGSAVACECGDSVGVVSLASGKVTGRVQCNEDQVTCLALAPDDSCLVVALKSTSLQQYQWPGLELARSFRSYHRGPVTAMSWDTTSTLIVTGGADSSARVWDLVNKYCTHSLKGASGVFGTVIFHPELTRVPQVYGGVSEKIHAWTLESGSSTMTATLTGHHSAVTALQVTHDTKHLVSCGLDRVIILWDLTTFTSQKVVPVLESLSGVLLQPQGSLFPGAEEDSDHVYALVVGDKGVPSVWEVDSGREVWRAAEPLLSLPDKDGVTLVNQVTYCKALDSVVMTTYDHSILFAKTSSIKIWKQLAGYNDQILDAVFVGAGESHLVVATNSIQLRIYHCETFSCCLIQGHTALVLALAKHPTLPNIFASSSHDNSVRVWCLTEDGGARCLATALGHTLSVGSVALSQDYMVTGSKDMCIKKWSLNKDILEGGKEDVSGAAAAVSLSSSHTEKAHEKDINNMCVSVNGKLIATGSQDKTAKVWDSKNLTLLGVLRGHRRGVWCVQFSPVDEVLATASADATIKIWTVTDFTNAITLEGHNMSVLRLCWVSEGQQLLSTASDGLLKLWTVRTRQCVQTFDEHQDKAWAMAVSGNEQRVVTGGEDAALILWRDVTQEEKDKAAEEAARFAAEEQTLLNLIQSKQWTKALGIAVRLGQPYRALKIMKTLLDESPDELPAVMARLRVDQVASLLEFATSWNTKTKDSREAQSVLNVVLKTFLPEELEGLNGWHKTLEGLLPYTERHQRRVAALHQSAGILSYMSSCLTLGVDPSDIELPKLMDEAELLTVIPAPQSDTGELEAEKESDNANSSEDEDMIKEEEDDDEEIKFALQNSIMKTGDGSESDDEGGDVDDEEMEALPANEDEQEINGVVMSEEDEGIEAGSEEKDGSEDEGSDGERTGEVPFASMDGLEGNFMLERVEISSGSEGEDAVSGGEEEEEQDFGKKRKGFSLDQLELETKKKKKKAQNVRENKGAKMQGKKMGKTQKGVFSQKGQPRKMGGKKGKGAPTRQSGKGKKRKKV